MKKSAFISDIIFTFFLASLFTLCLFRYLGLKLPFAALLSVLCGVLAACGIGAYLQSKRKSFFLKRSDESKKQRLLTHLALLTDAQKTAFFQEVLSNGEENAKRFSPLKLYTENAFYFLRFRFSPVEADEVASISRLKTAKPKIILCDRIEESAAKLAGALGVEYKTAEAVYTLVKDRGALPENFLGEEQPQDKKKRRLSLCFAKTNARRFFVAGALVLLTSLLTPFPYYYLIFGSLLLVVAVLVRIFGYR
ncbi:MAG: hypothetical protein IJ514_01550 [Clostridia bacterium]|nr:hypothetical protein [Clostridia bacterium]